MHISLVRRAFTLAAGPLAALAALTCASDPASALDARAALTQYGHDRWTTSDGLPQSTVAGIAQTPDGYLWLATPVGLARFDGARFVLFDTTNSDLPHNKVWSLFVARDGALWIGTDGGGVARMKDGRMTSFSMRNGLGLDIVRYIREGKDGTIWVATLGGGVSGIRDGAVVRTLTKKDGLPSDQIWGLLVDRAGALWIGTNGSGLARYQDGAVTQFESNGLPQNSVRCIFEDHAGALWIGTNDGLARMTGDHFERFTAKDGLPGDVVRDIVEDRQGSLWIATTSGLSRYRDGRFESLQAPGGLSGNFLRGLFEDREGSLWIGSFAGGLDRLRDVRFTVYGMPEGVPDDYVHAILETSDGSVWIGAHTGGLARLKNGQLRIYTKSEGLPDSTVMSLAEGRDGVLWLGTNGSGLVRFQNDRFQAFGKAQGLPSELLKALIEDHEGTLWIGTTEGLVARRNGAFQTYTTGDGLPDNFIRTLLEGADGTVWIGTSRGLARMKAGRLTAWTPAQGLPHPVPEALYEDETGALWIGSNGGGLARFKNGAFQAITSKSGLPDDIVYRILEDADHGIWLTSPGGIARVARSELEAVLDRRSPRVTAETFGPQDGLRSSECTGGFHPAGWKGRDGRLWFPTAGGVASVDPREQRRNTEPPPVRIEEVVADGHAVDVAAGPLPPGTGRLTFRYTALSLLVPSRVRFQHRLEPFDRKWVDAGTARVAQYTNIPPGRYRFHVKAANNDAVWNEQGAAVVLELTPHLYETRWFYALCAMGAVLLGRAVVKRREAGLRAREAELAKRVTERTAALQQEIGERARAEEALRQSEERYALAVRGANDGVWDWDLETGRVYFSPRWKAILGHHEDEIGDDPKEWMDRVHPEDAERVRSGIDAHCEGRSPHFEDEHRVRHRDGSYRWVLARGFAVRGPEGRPSRLIGVQTDVTDRRSYDPLTGLPNRALFVERLSRALLRAQRQPEYLIGVLFLDLDRFKVVNDSLGHLAGDRLLILQAQALQSCVRPGDMIARFGGDEFAVLVDSMHDVGDAIRVTERVQKEMQGLVNVGTAEIYTSVSIGIATSATPYESAEDLLRDADTAMYRAKAGGRARFELFDSEMRAQVMEQLEVESDLRRAVERDEFILHYQPVVCLRSGRLLGFEALLRWKHPRRGLVRPDDFIGVAEDTGLIVPLGYWVLHEACRQMDAWHREFRWDQPPTIAVNISARQFVDEALVAKTRAILEETGLPAGHLSLEITESVIMESAGRGVAMLAELKAFGVRLHLDDFGTGYSSLSYLHRFPVDALKIDRSFVTQMAADTESTALVRTILTMARNLEIAAVAEGVETMDQLARLRALGCDQAQGHYFAEALDPESARALMASQWRWPMPPDGAAEHTENDERSRAR